MEQVRAQKQEGDSMNPSNANTEDTDLPLSGIRVIDLIDGPMAMVGKQLADLGAEVLQIEPSTGFKARHAAPGIQNQGIQFIANSVGKRSITLDLNTQADLDQFHHLLEHSDIVLHCGKTDSTQLDGKELFLAHPHLVVQTISDFGVNSPCKDWVLTDAVAHALSGELWRSGKPEREPLLPPGQLVYACAASQAVFTVLLAYYHKLRSGTGDWLDFSILDGAAAALDPGFGIAGSATNGKSASELPATPRPDAQSQYPIFRCADGHVRVCILAPRQWRGMYRWMGQPSAFADPSFENLHTRFTSTELNAALGTFFSNRLRADLEREGQEYGVPVAGLLHMPEAISSTHLKARNALRYVTAGQTPLTLMNGLIEVDGQRAVGHTDFEALGQSQDVLEKPLGEKRSTFSPSDVCQRPLEGIRILDLGVIVVGAEQGRLFADQGAKVYKVENAAFPDGCRQSMDDSLQSVTFAAGHRNKQGLGLNLKSEEGKKLFMSLVANTDIIFSNFKPGTLNSLGLAYTDLQKINPRIIMVDSSAFGSHGPWSQRLGYGPLVRATAGLTYDWRYQDDPDGFCDAVTIYPDHTAGRIGASAALALLIRRRRTGMGGTASISQMEVMLGQMEARVVHSSLPSPVPFPSSICRPFQAAGKDEWLVICSQDPSQWPALCKAVNATDLAQQLDMLSADKLSDYIQDIEAAIAYWTLQHPPIEAMEFLQSQGISAGAMLRVAQLPEFKHYKHRQYFRWTSSPHVNRAFRMENAPVHSLRLPDPPDMPAPQIGEHTLEILQSQLGYSQAELEELLKNGDIETSMALS